jgi:hypothetical protein
MAELTTARDTEFRVMPTFKYADTLGAITITVDTNKGGPFRMQDYLTVDEAFKLAANLIAEVMRVERENGVEQDVPF